jgi:hypothetical protein
LKDEAYHFSSSLNSRSKENSAKYIKAGNMKKRTHKISPAPILTSSPEAVISPPPPERERTYFTYKKELTKRPTKKSFKGFWFFEVYKIAKEAKKSTTNKLDIIKPA